MKHCLAYFVIKLLNVSKIEAAMNKLFRALIAGWGARKLGFGCIGTIIVFIILYYLLGYVFG